MKRIAILLLVLSLGACITPNAPDTRSFDLGIAAPQAKLGAIHVESVRATAPFDGFDMHYRLAYRNAAELAAFASSRWAATPAELLRRQLLRAAGEGIAKCSLHVELHDFTQVFATQQSSEARVELRAMLTGPSGRLAVRSVNVVEPNAGADATSGAAAFARAVERAVGELSRWTATQTSCN